MCVPHRPQDWDNTGVIAIEFFITGVHPNGTEMTRSFVPEFVMPSFDSVSSSARGLPGDPVRCLFLSGVCLLCAVLAGRWSREGGGMGHGCQSQHYAFTGSFALYFA